MTPILQHYLKEYDKFKSYLIKTQHSLSLEKRQRAFNTFYQKGFPSTQEEAWAGIARSPFLQHAFHIALPNTERTHISGTLPKMWEPSAIRFVFINGYFSKQLSSPLSTLPDGLHVQTLAELSQQASQATESNDLDQDVTTLNPFAAINQAFSQDGMIITVDDYHVIEPLIELCFIGEPSLEALPLLIATHHKIKIGQKSRVRFLETYWPACSAAAASLFMNVITTLRLEAAADVIWAQNIQAEQGYIHVGALEVSQDAKSHFALESFVRGGSLVRHTVPICLSGEGASAQVQALSLSKEKHNIDHQIMLQHEASYTSSSVDYRAIADEQSRIGFRGEVHAIAGVIQVQAKQNSRNLLLSNQAVIDTQPRLELFTDDLMCTHGATVGSLDEAALFYLQSRGIPKTKARALLIEAFSQSILDKMLILSSAVLK